MTNADLSMLLLCRMSSDPPLLLSSHDEVFSNMQSEHTTSSAITSASKTDFFKRPSNADH